MSKRAKHHLLLYSIIINQWKTIPTTIPLNSDGETHLLDDGRLFALGVIKDNEDLFPCEYYNLYNTQYFRKIWLYF